MGEGKAVFLNGVAPDIWKTLQGGPYTQPTQSELGFLSERKRT